MSGMADALRRRLLDELPGFGRHLGYDGKAVDSHSTGREDAKSGKTSDPDADWGKHETHGVDRRTGKAWTKVKRWFGYGLHLIADVEHEIPVWFEVTEASRSEHKALSAALDELFADEPELAARCADFCADRGLDAGPLKRKLWDGHRVRPLIDVREMWREEREAPGWDPSKPILRSLAKDGGGNVSHSEKGEVLCRCPATGTERPMAFQGFEKDRGTLKYRCPAAAYDLDCKGREECCRAAGAKAGDYGRVARIALKDQDRRMFHADALGRPLLAARLQPARRAGAVQRPRRRRLRLREPLHPRQGEDEGADGAGAVRHDGAGPGRGHGRAPRADALAGRSRACRSRRRPPPRRPRRSTGPVEGRPRAPRPQMRAVLIWTPQRDSKRRAEGPRRRPAGWGRPEIGRRADENGSAPAKNPYSASAS